MSLYAHKSSLLKFQRNRVIFVDFKKWGLGVAVILGGGEVSRLKNIFSPSETNSSQNIKIGAQILELLDKTCADGTQTPSQPSRNGIFK